MSSLKCNGFDRQGAPLGEFGLDDFGIDLARRSEVEDLARPVIEHCFDVGELLGRDGGQIGPLGQGGFKPEVQHPRYQWIVALRGRYSVLWTRSAL